MIANMPQLRRGVVAAAASPGGQAGDEPGVDGAHSQATGVCVNGHVVAVSASPSRLLERI